MKAIRPWIAMIGVAWIGAGCASPGIRHAYKGPEESPRKLAAVWGSTDGAGRTLAGPRERISVTAVDGRRTIPWHSFRAYPTAVYVRPGKRKLDVQFEHIHGVAVSPVWVDAKARRTYRIRVMNPEARTERVYFVIEDVTAQTLVGGAEQQPE